MASAQQPDIPPDNRIEPVILTDLAFDDDARNQTEPASHRMLAATLLISVLAHVVILALAANSAKRDGQRPEPIIAQPSIQIRFRQPPPPPTTSTEQSTTTESIAPPDEPATPAEETASAEVMPPIESAPSEPDATPAESIAETPAAPQLLPLPSLTDLRTAARNRAEQDRQSRSTHPDCLIRERRHAYLDCGDGQGYDYAGAGQNDTVAFFSSMLSTAAEDGVDDQTATGARVKAALDMFDNQLGTTQTKKRIMNFP